MHLLNQVTNAPMSREPVAQCQTVTLAGQGCKRIGDVLSAAHYGVEDGCQFSIEGPKGMSTRAMMRAISEANPRNHDSLVGATFFD